MTATAVTTSSVTTTNVTTAVTTSSVTGTAAIDEGFELRTHSQSLCLILVVYLALCDVIPCLTIYINYDFKTH